MRFRHEGRAYERVAGPTKTIGYTLLARVQAELGLRRPVEEVLAEVFGDPFGPNLTFREAVPLYLEYATPRKKATTIAADGPRLNYVAKEGWAKLPLRDITQRDLSRFVTKLLRAGPRGKPCATSTVNRYLAAISGLYRSAIREGYASENPTKGVERWNETGNARETYLDADEARASIAAAPERFRAFIASPSARIAAGTRSDRCADATSTGSALRSTSAPRTARPSAGGRSRCRTNSWPI